MKIGIIGGGWYGAHTARIFAAAGDMVTILEAGPTIFGGISGMFGIRRHEGPHYPRSKKTRESCRRGSKDFEKFYANLIIQHKNSVYGLGVQDSDGHPSKVTLKEFEEVCNESPSCRQVDLETWGYSGDNIQAAFELHEPSIAVGKRLRATMENYLKEDGIEIIYNYSVTQITKVKDKIVVNNDLEFDQVINATSFMTLLPEKPLPFNIDVKYQVCLALVYEDQRMGNGLEPPFSLIFMDGWYPCLMPYDDRAKTERHINRQYIMTHGKWTILGTRDTVNEAKSLAEKINDDFVVNQIRPRCEADMQRFWPMFNTLFLYKSWVVNVIAKIKNEREFRSAVTFADDIMTYIIPGKVTNIGDAARESLALSRKEKIKTVTTQGKTYHYVQDGVLDDAQQEITEKPVDNSRNTCDLQTYEELMLAANVVKVKNTSGSFLPRIQSFIPNNAPSPVASPLPDQKLNFAYPH